MGHRDLRNPRPGVVDRASHPACGKSSSHDLVHPESFGAEVVNLGLVDNPLVSRSVGDRFHTENVDILFLYISTYALSSTVLPVAQRAGVPVVVLNLQPTAQLDYAAFNALGDRGTMTGTWLEKLPVLQCSGNRLRV